MSIAPIGTGLSFDRGSAAMGSLSAAADRLTTQLSSNKRLQSASDDVVAYQRLRTLARNASDDTAYSANVSLAQSVLQQGDTALGSIVDQLQQARTLATQAANGTLNDHDKAAIASQLDSILASLSGLANATDTRGQPLFGDASGGAAVTQAPDGTYSFATAAPGAVPVGDGVSLQPNETAARVFTFTGKAGTATDAFSAIAALSAALKAGGDTSAATATALDDLKAAQDRATGVQASLGARSAQLDLVASQAKTAATDREAARSALEDTDVTATITELQKTMTVLQATQASFTKLTSLSLFDYLR